MAMQQSYHGSGSKVTPLRTVEHPNAFGAHLRFIREREQLQQREVAEALPEYYEEYHVTFPTSDPRDMYRKLEKGIRAAQYEELLPIYATLVGCGIRQSAEERHKFVSLARKKLETLRRRRPADRHQGDWDWLEAQLAKLDQQPSKSQAKNAFEAALRENAFDISHVVGREEWLSNALAYLQATPAKKLVLIQGMMGMGKSTCLHLLLHTLGTQDNYLPIMHLFSDRPDMTGDDHLDNFLATMLARLEVAIPETKMPDRQQQLQLLLNALASTKQRIVVLLDDAQVILDEQGHLPSSWEYFIAEFLCRPHQATIFLATREWPTWTGRGHTFIVDGDEAWLPPVSPQAGALIWKRLGFEDVDEGLLKQATERFGGNARMIELRAATLQRRKFSFSWPQATLLPALTERSEQKSERQELLERLLEEQQIFGATDIEVNELLQHVVSQHISHDAHRLLDVLAVSPLALPFPLLKAITPEAEYAFVELLNASLLDRAALAHERAGLQPLTREAKLHALRVECRMDTAEQQIIKIYEIWLKQGTFRDGREKGDVVAEFAVALLKQRRLLEAAQLWIRFGWLAANQGYGSRVARLSSQMSQESVHLSADLGNECGALLLHYLLSPYLNCTIDASKRAADYQHIYDLVLAGEVQLDPVTDLHVVHHRMSAAIGQSRYQAAQAILEECSQRVEPHLRSDTELQASLLERYGWLYTTWCEYAEEHEGLQVAQSLREKAIAIYQQCSELLVQSVAGFPLQKSQLQKRLARCYNNV